MTDQCFLVLQDLLSHCLDVVIAHGFLVTFQTSFVCSQAVVCALRSHTQDCALLYCSTHVSLMECCVWELFPCLHIWIHQTN